MIEHSRNFPKDKVHSYYSAWYFSATIKCSRVSNFWATRRNYSTSVFGFPTPCNSFSTSTSHNSLLEKCFCLGESNLDHSIIRQLLLPHQPLSTCVRKRSTWANAATFQENLVVFWSFQFFCIIAEDFENLEFCLSYLEVVSIWLYWIVYL